MLKWYYKDEEFDTEDDAIEACSEDMENNGIQSHEAEFDILTAIRQGNE